MCTPQSSRRSCSGVKCTKSEQRKLANKSDFRGRSHAQHRAGTRTPNPIKPFFVHPSHAGGNGKQRRRRHHQARGHRAVLGPLPRGDRAAAEQISRQRSKIRDARAARPSRAGSLVSPQAPPTRMHPQSQPIPGTVHSQHQHQRTTIRSSSMPTQPATQPARW